jgi:hypothetical protein
VFQCVQDVAGKSGQQLSQQCRVMWCYLFARLHIPTPVEANFLLLLLVSHLRKLVATFRALNLLLFHHRHDARLPGLPRLRLNPAHVALFGGVRPEQPTPVFSVLAALASFILRLGLKTQTLSVGHWWGLEGGRLGFEGEWHLRRRGESRRRAGQLGDVEVGATPKDGVNRRAQRSRQEGSGACPKGRSCLKWRCHCFRRRCKAS